MPVTAVIGPPSGDPRNATAASTSVTTSQVTPSTRVAAGHPPAASGILPGAPAIAIRAEGAAPAGLPNPDNQPVHAAAARSAGTKDADLAGRSQAAQTTAARTLPGGGPAVTLAVPQPAGPADGKPPAIGHGIFDSGSAPAAVTGANPAPLGAVTNMAPPMSAAASSAAGLSQSPLAGQAPAVPAMATALAASVVAMSQSGQSTAVLRLDPPGLGSLSIHIALTANATVNVVFVPSVPQTALLIHSALPDLHHAMASAGLSLGEAQIGGGTGGNPSGQARNQTGDGSRFAQTTMLSRAAAGADPALAKDLLRGARAVA